MLSVKHPIWKAGAGSLLLLALVVLQPGDATAAPPRLGVGVAQRARPAVDGFARGMALGMYSGISNRVLNRKLREVKALGVSHVSLVVSWSMENVNSTRISARARYSTPDADLRRMIMRARSMKMEVFLFPIIEVHQRSLGQWRGTIKPPDWDAWWRNYRRFIMHYARIAAQTNVAMFCVGSELVSTEHDRARWKTLISQVRQVYTGKLVYSANWDHYQPVSFWDLVDVAGLTAYYKIADGTYATEDWMVRQWMRIRRRLNRWSVREIKRPFIFTEVGYPSRDGGAVEPWDYTKGTPIDLEEQRRAFSAFTRAWNGSTRLAGVFFWDWYGQGGPSCRRYTPRRKPAAEVIRRWFRRKAKIQRAWRRRGRSGWGAFPSRCLDDRIDSRSPCM